MSRFLPILALFAPPAAENHRHLLFRYWWLWLGTVVLAILAIFIIGALGSGRRRALALTARRKRRRAIKDAWVEAGKRAEPEPLDSDDLEDPDAREPGSDPDEP